MATANRSKEFFDLIKSIGEAKSKQEEDEIITNEVVVLKQKMFEPKITVKTMKELLVRMIYVEMLGHDASFGHINAVKMTNDSNTVVKRIAYLAVCLCLHPEHELMLLLVNTLQKDLKSPNHVEVSLALHTIAKLINKDLIPAVIAPVGEALTHRQSSVRKKAVMVLQRFFQVDKESTVTYIDKAKRLLCDKDPSVMGASLHLIYDLAVQDPGSYKELIPSLVSILKQITEHRLPRDFDYHRMPAPWIQIKLLQILSVLGALDKTASEGMYEILSEVLRRADIGINVGYAIIYETVRTITHVYPDHNLLEEAAKCVSRFITAENHNLKYLGINALANIVQVDSKYALDHQLIVIDCLEDPDETLRRKTLDLLYRMTNPANVVIIVDKLIGSLKSTIDVFLRKELVLRITQLAERYAPDTFWYIDIMNVVFEQAGDLVEKAVPNNLMKLILETEESEDDDRDVRIYAVETYMELLEKSVLPSVSLKVISWVIGEFGHMLESASKEEMIHRLCEILDRPLGDSDADIRCWVVSAIMKLSVHVATLPDNVIKLLEKFRSSVDVDLQQRSHEFLELLHNFKTLRTIIPPNQASEELNIDDELRFLNSYVNMALKAGARPYATPEQREAALRRNQPAEPETSSSLNFKEYAPPPNPLAAPATRDLSASISAPSDFIRGGNERSDQPTLNVTSRKWGAEGYVDESKKIAETKPPVTQYGGPSAPLPNTSVPTFTRQESRSTVSKPSSPPVDPAQEEKLMRAQQLFGGVGTDSVQHSKSTSSKGTKGKKSKAPAAAKPAGNVPSVVTPSLATAADPSPMPQASIPQSISAPQPVPTKAPAVDLLDLTFAAVAQPNQAARPAPVSSSVVDLLDFVTPAATAKPSTAVTKSKPPAGDPLFSTLGSSTQMPSQTRKANDPFDFLGGSPITESKLDSPKLGVPNSGHEMMSANMKKKIEGLPRSAEIDQVVSADQFIRISSYTIWAPFQTIIAIFIGNQTASPFQKITVKVDPPVSFVIGFDGEPSLTVEGNCVAIPLLEPNSSSVVCVSLAAGSPVSTMESGLNAQVSYTNPVSGQVVVQNIVLPLTYADFLRPAVMNTNQFGSKWKTLTQEAKYSMRSSCSTSAEVMSRLESTVKAHAVQTIGVENIAAVYLIHGSATNLSVILIHVKVNSGSVDVLVRSGNKQLSASILKFVSFYLQ